MTGYCYYNGTAFVDICNNMSSYRNNTPTFNSAPFNTGFNLNGVDLSTLYYLNTTLTNNITQNFNVNYNSTYTDINQFFYIIQE